MELPEVFERYRVAIDAQLHAALDECNSSLYDMLRYHLGWIDEQGNAVPGSSGKALRPTLCLLGCEAAGADFHRALPAAAALELVHNFSLIHDDVQDDDRERRHRPTVWTIWGRAQAINAGTAMHLVANIELHRLLGKGLPADRLIEAQQLLDRTCLRLIEGQYLDLSYESRLDVGVSDYVAMIERKTGDLISCSLQLGGLVGTTEQRTIRALRDFGSNLGLAFQIRDDILGIWGEESKTGKATGSDIRRKKKSLPVVYAFEKSTGTWRSLLLNIYSQAVIDNQGLHSVLVILDEMGAQAAAQAMVERYRDLAVDALGGADIAPRARADLEGIAEFLATREF